MLNVKKSAVAAVVALVLAAGSVAPSMAQGTAYQRSMAESHSGVRAFDDTPVQPHDGGTTTTGDPDYTDTFTAVTTEVTGAISGPGKLAIGVMILGVIFSVVWKLVRKGGKAIGS